MKKMLLLAAARMLTATVVAGSAAAGEMKVVDLDGPWSFSRNGGPFETVRVPHDWAIAGPFVATDYGDTGKLPWRGTGEYRRVFELPTAPTADTKAYLEFDGAMARPVVHVNGRRAGSWEYGYLGFRLDVTAFLKAGENVLRVTLDTRPHISRWYPGAGLYRSVRLKVFKGEHVVPGTLAVTTPAVDRKAATVRIDYVSSEKGPQTRTFTVENPRLWDVDDPFLYETEVLGERVRYGIRTFVFTADDGFHLNGRRVQLKGVNLHSDLGPLGMAFDRSAARRQLEMMKEMGVNALRTSHNPPAPEVLDLCDEMGLVVWDECFDSWGCFNQPVLTYARVSCASRLDSEPLEEYVEKNLAAFVARDRNHPCVVIWSIGNEISPASEGNPDGSTPERVRRFRDFVHAIDPTRPVGMGCCNFGEIPRGGYDQTDVSGWNYNRHYASMRLHKPAMPLVYSESASALSSFGYYEPTFYDDRTRLYDADLEVSGYDRFAYGYCDIPDYEFENMERDRYVAGEFVWTGIDYLGEPVPYHFRGAVPQEKMARSAYYGIMDLTLQPKDRYWLYRSYWRPETTTVHLLPHWTWPDRVGKKVPVYCYTNGDEAELFVNGRSAGRRRKDPAVTREFRDSRDAKYFRLCEKYRLMWPEVVYEPGELKVVAYRNGVRIGEDVRRTAGAPVAVRLDVNALGLNVRPDVLATDGSVAYVRVTTADAKGVMCPEERRRVDFAIEGPGEILAVGNGDPRDLKSFKDVSHHVLYHGVATVIVRRTPGEKGTVRLRASSSGLADAALSFD